MYCDSEYYFGTYKGNIVPQNKIDTMLILASNKVRMSILNRDITGYEDLVKRCTCHIADLLYSQDLRRTQTSSEGAISSESVGDYSRTFVNSTSSGVRDTNEGATFEVLELYLGATGLLYRGLSV